MNKSPKKNAEGYSDSTAYAALSKIEKQERQARKVKKMLNQMCELSGYRIKGQITLVDRASGQAFKL